MGPDYRSQDAGAYIRQTSAYASVDEVQWRTSAFDHLILLLVRLLGVASTTDDVESLMASVTATWNTQGLPPGTDYDAILDIEVATSNLQTLFQSAPATIPAESVQEFQETLTEIRESIGVGRANSDSDHGGVL